ncbi:uncharacterized protein LW93_14691 [Fusarium fujikuroi]|nr:uncharacterized protein LW93_14691 [Fusarium fujikuroi]
MSSTSANIPAWQQKIRAKVAALSAPTLGTMSMSSLKATESAQLAAPMSRENLWGQENGTDQLLSILVACVENIRTAAGTCINSIQDLKNTKPDPAVWKATINIAHQTAKKSFDKWLDSATDDAIKVINRLPEAQQDGAADFYIDGMDIIANTVNQVSIDLGAIGTRYLSDFLKGDWSGLTKVENNVKAACDGAIHGLNSIKR